MLQQIAKVNIPSNHLSDFISGFLNNICYQLSPGVICHFILQQVKSPGGPPPRCSHQAVVTSGAGGRMWVFGGEYAR